MNRILLASLVAAGMTVAIPVMAQETKSMPGADIQQTSPGQPLAPEAGEMKPVTVDDIRARDVFNREGSMVGKVKDVVLTKDNEYVFIIQGDGDWQGKDFVAEHRQIFLADEARLNLYPTGSDDTPSPVDPAEVAESGYRLSGGQEVYVTTPK